MRPVLLCLLLTGCQSGSSLVVGFGVGPANAVRVQGDGKDITSELYLEQRWEVGDNHLWCRVYHNSNVLSGSPFNSDPESVVDGARCGIETTLKGGP